MKGASCESKDLRKEAQTPKASSPEKEQSVNACIQFDLFANIITIQAHKQFYQHSLIPVITDLKLFVFVRGRPKRMLHI